jgi:protein-disulfide isomerase
MLLTQVNRAPAFCAALIVFLACTPSGTKTGASESANAVPARASTSTPQKTAQDSNITKADVARTDGSANAPVWVVVISDYQCPFCKEWHDATYPALDREFVKTGKARVAFVNFPLQSHPQAWPAAEAAMCAAAQGNFWRMHDAIFDTQQKWASSSAPATVFDSLARASGVEFNRWKQCVTSGIIRPLIEADQQRATAAGVRSTPTIIIGNQFLAGAHPIETIRRAIDSATVKSGR